MNCLVKALLTSVGKQLVKWFTPFLCFFWGNSVQEKDCFEMEFAQCHLWICSSVGATIAPLSYTAQGFSIVLESKLKSPYKCQECWPVLFRFHWCLLFFFFWGKIKSSITLGGTNINKNKLGQYSFQQIEEVKLRVSFTFFFLKMQFPGNSNHNMLQFFKNGNRNFNKISIDKRYGVLNSTHILETFIMYTCFPANSFPLSPQK